MNEWPIRTASLLLLLFIGLGQPPRGEAATPAQMAFQAYFEGSNTEANDYFGASVAVSGNTAVVGAYGEASSAVGVNGDQTDDSSGGAGAAYVFVRTGTNWSQQAYLKASNTEAGDLFGSSVAISGNTIVIGAPYEDSDATPVHGNQGAAYVFVRNGTNWSQQAYLKASSLSEGDQFGSSVAVSGDIIVIGAPLKDTDGVIGSTNPPVLNAGAAYIFARTGTTWVQAAQLKGYGGRGVTDGQFGSSVAVSKNRVLVGEAGWAAAYFFVRSGTSWIQEDSLQFSHAAGSFGASVALSGDIAVVGAPAGGNVYFFVRNGTNWVQDHYYVSGSSETGSGYSVAVSGSTAVIGARLEDGNATGVNGQNTGTAQDSGASYVHVRKGTNWEAQAYLKASNTRGPLLIWSSPSMFFYCCHQYFGKAVAVSADTVIVGTEDSNGINDAASGGAYIFTGAGVGTCITVARDGALGYLLGFNATPGETYRLRRASTISGLWSTVSTQTASASGRIEYHDTAPLPGQAFYRTVQP